MAATWAEAATQIKNAVKVFTDVLADSGDTPTNVDTLEQALEGDYLPGALIDYAARFRALHSSVLSPGLMRLAWDGWALEVAKIAGIPDRGVALWRRIHRYMHDNSYSFNDRNWTRGSPAAGGSNVGTGTLARLTVDWEAYPLQGGHIETKTLECVIDQNLGADKGAETFVVRGEDASKDFLGYRGSGIQKTMSVIHEGSGANGSRLVNSGFDVAFNGSGSDKIQGWTIGGTVGNVTADTSTYYKIAPGEESGQALAIAASSGEVVQALSENLINAISEFTPWGLQVAFKKTGASDTGTITLKCGSKSQAFDISTYNNTTWNVIRLDMDKDLYYRNWKEDAPDIEIEWASTSDVMWLDACIFAPLAFEDETFWWLTGGQTAFLARDSFTAADSGAAAADGEMMYAAWWARLPVSLPTNNADSETITDP